MNVDQGSVPSLNTLGKLCAFGAIFLATSLSSSVPWHYLKTVVKPGGGEVIFPCISSALLSFFSRGAGEHSAFERIT